MHIYMYAHVFTKSGGFSQVVLTLYVYIWDSLFHFTISNIHVLERIIFYLKLETLVQAVVLGQFVHHPTQQSHNK